MENKLRLLERRSILDPEDLSIALKFVRFQNLVNLKKKRKTCVSLDLTEMSWRSIQSLMPGEKNMGRPRANDRRVINAIIYALANNCPWGSIPSRYGSGVTAWRRLKRWQEDGVWDQIWSVYISSLDKRSWSFWALL
jgi:hypothetical protein